MAFGPIGRWKRRRGEALVGESELPGEVELLSPSGVRKE